MTVDQRRDIETVLFELDNAKRVKFMKKVIDTANTLGARARDDTLEKEFWRAVSFLIAKYDKFGLIFIKEIGACLRML